jgi:ADP-heptose:LPS heptosyltransferase
LDDPAPRLLFVPVSGAFGMGEYARSLAIARGAAERWPRASIKFILSRAAPYAAQSPFPAALLASSPTFHSAAVIEIMNDWRPDIVIFDNAGRTAQLRAARKIGARVVYISSRRRQRNKAFRVSWMLLIDEHWIAYPEFLAGGLKFMERLKRYLLGRPAVRYLDVILARESPAPRLGIAVDYLLMVPGGGTGHPGAGDAVEVFLQAARGLAALGVDTVLVGRVGTPSAVTEAAPGGSAAGFAAGSRAQLLGSLPQAELADLMRGARLVIANGGSTLLQSIACGKACVAVPIAGDQAERIRRCVDLGVAVAAPLAADAIVKIAADLWRDGARLDALAGRAVALRLADGLDAALRAITGLLATRSLSEYST